MMRAMHLMFAWPIAIGIVCLGGGSAARAAESEENIEQARKYFEAGREAYEAGLFPGAVSAFQEAYRLAPRPQIVFSLAQAHRRQFFVDRDPTNLKQAIERFRQYINEVKQGGRRSDAVQFLEELEPVWKTIEKVGAARPPKAKVEPTQLMISSHTKDALASIDGGQLSEVPLLVDLKPGKHKVHIEANGFYPEDTEGLAVDGRLVVVELNLREKPATIALFGPEGAEVTLNGRPVGTVPLLRPIEVNAGPHFLAVTHRGSHPFTRELVLNRSEAVTVDVSLETTTQRQIAYWVLGGAAAILASGAVTTGLAFGAQSSAKTDEAAIRHKLNMNMNATAGDLVRYNHDVQKRDHLVVASGVLYGTALAAGLVGALMYLVDNPRVEQPSSARAP